MLAEIKNAYMGGRLMLLLGAGASYGSLDQNNIKLPMGDDLAKEIAELMGWSYKDEPLGNVYSAANSINSSELHKFFRSRFTNTKPSAELRVIASFPWFRIFTLNIDDCMEKALRGTKLQKVNIFSRNSPLEEYDPILKTVQLIKLNGSADRPEDGFIFSPQEYGEGSARLPIWYREMGNSYSNYTFVFIGSKLNESLFQHAFALMRSTANREPLRGYVVSPSASEIETHHLKSFNLVHIPGTLKSFADWMLREIPRNLTGWDIATTRRPELRNIHHNLNDQQKRALNSITLVSPNSLPKPKPDKSTGAIREFYRGYKPSWGDIVDNIPAELSFIKEFSAVVQQNLCGKKCIALVGPAGSGKSTALMMTALQISKSTATPVYFLREAVSDLEEIVISLEGLNNSPFYLFIDKIESVDDQIHRLLSSSSTKNVCIVFSERLNIWNRRVKTKIEFFVSHKYSVAKILKKDAGLILEKLEKFGPWTRLQPMKLEQRVAEIYNRADRQLLIGLMEATIGRGFTNIIDSDFKNLGDDHHRKFLVIAGLASIHRSTLSSQIVNSALSNLGIMEDTNSLSGATEGIVVTNSKKFSARHPVYVRELFEKIVPVMMIRDCLIAVLEAFSDYEAPVLRNVNKDDGIVFKSIINHRFVTGILRNDREKIRSVYENFETRFHIDGLYWLQYGLALRSFGNNMEALDKLKTAREAYASVQIEHAYSQQLMIIANMSQNWVEAEPMLNEAINALRKLSQTAGAEDTYSIVTLAEGHLTVMLKFFGTEGAKTISQQYANELLAIYRQYPSARLEETVNNVVKLATTGTWKESYGPSYADEDV